MVKYLLDKDLDTEIASVFLGHSRAGVDFGQGVWRPHPALKGLTRNDKAKIARYIEKYYKENFDELNGIKDDYQNKWNEVESGFIKETKSLFNDYEFPQGKYVGYISIFNCNPRFLHNLTFQVYYKTDSSIRVTAHEFLHFIFYEYTSEKFSKIVQDLDTNRGLWWDVSEIFNNVVLSSDKFRSTLKIEGDNPYPDHEKYLRQANQIWIEHEDIDTFILKLFELMQG